MRQRGALQLQLRAVDAVTQRRVLQSDRRARIQSTPQTDVARPFQNIQSADLNTLSQTFSVIATDLVQRSSPGGSLVHVLDDHHLRPPQPTVSEPIHIPITPVSAPQLPVNPTVQVPHSFECLCDGPNGNHLVHVPMSLRARTSALDL